MKAKILLFLLSFIVNMYCINSHSTKKLKNIKQQKSLHKTIKKKKSYSVKCYKSKCTKTFTRKSKVALLYPLARHLYSQKHKYELYDEFYKHVKKNAYKIDGKWSIKYSKKKRFNAPNIPALVSILITHEFATEKNNPDVFKKIKNYIDANVKTIYEN